MRTTPTPAASQGARFASANTTMQNARETGVACFEGNKNARCTDGGGNGQRACSQNSRTGKLEQYGGDESNAHGIHQRVPGVKVGQMRGCEPPVFAFDNRTPVESQRVQPE